MGLVNTSGIPCVRCMESNSQLNVMTFYFINGDTVTSRPDVVVIDGVLAVLDSEMVIPAGNSPLLLSCQALGAFVYNDIELFSSGKHYFYGL